MQRVVAVNTNCYPTLSTDHTGATPRRHWAGPSQAKSDDLTAGSLQQGDTDWRKCHAISNFICHKQYNVFSAEQANVNKGDKAERKKPWINWILRTKHKGIDIKWCSSVSIGNRKRYWWPGNRGSISAEVETFVNLQGSSRLFSGYPEIYTGI